LFKSANLRELHDAPVFRAHAGILPPKWHYDHTTIGSERKLYLPQGDASLPPQNNIVTPVEQLLLFTKSFSFFCGAHFGASAAENSSLPGPTRQRSVAGD
jgi:hypothetical protein